MTHYRTDDVRIEQGDELLAPMQVMRELPATRRHRARHLRGPPGHPRHPARRRRPPARGGGPVLHPRPQGRARVRHAPEGRARAPRRRAPHRDARVLREAAHHRGLEGPHQRPAPERHLRHERGPAPRAQAPARHQRHGRSLRHRVPRPHLAAVHRRPHLLGRHRRAHDGIAVAPPARLGPFLPGGLQERHRRQHPHRRGRHQGRQRAPPLHLGHQERARGRVQDRRATRTAT